MMWTTSFLLVVNSSSPLPQTITGKAAEIRFSTLQPLGIFFALLEDSIPHLSLESARAGDSGMRKPRERTNTLSQEPQDFLAAT
jgi:hypothetical protein